jgi:hypothetical protein
MTTKLKIYINSPFVSCAVFKIRFCHKSPSSEKKGPELYSFVNYFLSNHSIIAPSNTFATPYNTTQHNTIVYN